MSSDNLGLPAVSIDIWDRKYRYAAKDKSVRDTMKRVAKACAVKEKDPDFWAKEFESILCGLEFLPGGRIIANAGTSREEVTMFNCYVMNTIKDSIEGIFDTVKDSAMTQKQGGGVGFDFSTIRPAGSHINGCEAEASGPLSFMQVLDSTCRTIMSAGQRRGAQMGIMRCDHPDIEHFITAKRQNSQLQMFNLSVAITDAFMEAVKIDGDWDLVFGGKVYKTVKAKYLWDMILHSSYDYAEPGFILIDRINKMNNLAYCEKIAATNPCGEQPLPPYGACLLGSVNLSRMVDCPFTVNAKVNYQRIGEVAATAVRLLDNVIDISNYPLPQQREEAYAKRRMGIGITGLADAFIFMGVKYGSPASLVIAEKIMATIRDCTYRASVELAKERGAFPRFEADKYVKGSFVATLPKDLQKEIAKSGIRNSHLTSIAPTGTISLLAGNISSGLEPVFAFRYTRKIRNGKETDVSEVEVADYAYSKYCEFIGKHSCPENELPDYFVSADSITPMDHLEIQAALQRNVDSSISKTINIPGDYKFEDYENIYMQAYQKGLKGCTTFRPSEYITGILIRKEDKKEEKKEAAKPVETSKKITRRPEVLTGTTYKIKTPHSPDAFYITINDYEENGQRRPYELFINTKNLQHFSWIVAMSRLISAVFRHEAKPVFLVEELKSVYDPSGGYFQKGKYIPSLAAEIGYVIESHLQSIGILTHDHEHAGNGSKTEKMSAPIGQSPTNNKMFCPQCNEKELVNQENCLKCLACGYGKCG